MILRSKLLWDSVKNFHTKSICDGDIEAMRDRVLANRLSFLGWKIYLEDTIFYIYFYIMWAKIVKKTIKMSFYC